MRKLWLKEVKTLAQGYIARIGNKKEQTTDICYNVYELHRPHAKWKKPDTEDYICIILFILNVHIAQI